MRKVLIFTFFVLLLIIFVELIYFFLSYKKQDKLQAKSYNYTVVNEFNSNKNIFKDEIDSYITKIEKKKTVSPFLSDLIISLYHPARDFEIYLYTKDNNLKVFKKKYLFIYQPIKIDELKVGDYLSVKRTHDANNHFNPYDKIIIIKK